MLGCVAKVGRESAEIGSTDPRTGRSTAYGKALPGTGNYANHDDGVVNWVVPMPIIAPHP